MTSTEDTQPTEPSSAPRRLQRSQSDRVLAGVCGGLAKYFNIDATIVRIVGVALVVLGGLGIALYLAALLLMPEEGSEQAAPISRGGGMSVAAIAALLVLALVVIPGVGFLAGWLVWPLAFLALAGLAAWWISTGRPVGDSAGTIAARIAIGLGILAVAGAVAIGGAILAATGSDTLAAVLVIGAGVALVAAAFVRRGRWLVLPALALGLSVGVVAASGIDADGGVGEKVYRPASEAAIQDRYELGIGQLVVDLRGADIERDRTVAVDVGVGEAVVLVPDDVCVSTKAKLGVGGVDVFARESGGVDVDWVDERNAPAGTPTVLVDADVGIGHVEVGRVRGFDHGGFGARFGRDRFNDLDPDAGGNRACAA